MAFERLKEMWQAGKVVSKWRPIERLRVGQDVLDFERVARRIPPRPSSETTQQKTP